MPMSTRSPNSTLELFRWISETKGSATPAGVRERLAQDLGLLGESGSNRPDRIRLDLGDRIDARLFLGLRQRLRGGRILRLADESARAIRNCAGVSAGLAGGVPGLPGSPTGATRGRWCSAGGLPIRRRRRRRAGGCRDRRLCTGRRSAGRGSGRRGRRLSACGGRRGHRGRLERPPGPAAGPRRP